MEVVVLLKFRLIYVYLLRYIDKEKIFKVVLSKFKNNYYKDLLIFILDNVLKLVWEDCVIFWRIYFVDIKGKLNVIFVFIFWSVLV